MENKRGLIVISALVDTSPGSGTGSVTEILDGIRKSLEGRVTNCAASAYQLTDEPAEGAPLSDVLVFLREALVDAVKANVEQTVAHYLSVTKAKVEA